MIFILLASKKDLDQSSEEKGTMSCASLLKYIALFVYLFP